MKISLYYYVNMSIDFFFFFFANMIHPKLKFNDNEFYYRTDDIG